MLAAKIREPLLLLPTLLAKQKCLERFENDRLVSNQAPTFYAVDDRI
jgi:hypothetical protein